MEKGSKGKMETLRKPLQGVSNILRFNWHFYLIALGTICLLFIVSQILVNPYSAACFALLGLIIAGVTISFCVSLYIYDLSGLYKLEWIDNLSMQPGSRIINVNAGFDETSDIINIKLPETALTVFDFYNPLKHTEVSIKRARRAYPPYTGTISISTSSIPLLDSYADYVFIIFSAHEIRDVHERCLFFKELHRVIKPDGKVVVLEHIRDHNNFLAYNIGFFHFLSKSSWYDTFKNSDFKILHENRFTPFITQFTLVKNGIPS